MIWLCLRSQIGVPCFWAASYTVDRGILMCILSDIDFRGKVQYWFKTYLQHRTSYVVVGEEKFSSAVTKTGVLQGNISAHMSFYSYGESVLITWKIWWNLSAFWRLISMFLEIVEDGAKLLSIYGALQT